MLLCSPISRNAKCVCVNYDQRHYACVTAVGLRESSRAAARAIHARVLVMPRRMAAAPLLIFRFRDVCCSVRLLLLIRRVNFFFLHPCVPQPPTAATHPFARPAIGRSIKFFAGGSSLPPRRRGSSSTASPPSTPRQPGRAARATTTAIRRRTTTASARKIIFADPELWRADGKRRKRGHRTTYAGTHSGKQTKTNDDGSASKRRGNRFRGGGGKQPTTQRCAVEKPTTTNESSTTMARLVRNDFFDEFLVGSVAWLPRAADCTHNFTGPMTCTKL